MGEAYHGLDLDAAIEHLNETLSDENHEWSCEECKQDHVALREFLIELKCYRELGTIKQVSDAVTMYNRTKERIKWLEENS